MRRDNIQNRQRRKIKAVFAEYPSLPDRKLFREGLFCPLPYGRKGMLMSAKKWSSSFGFIMASVGAALGLGNIWGFPYKLGQGGGFVYLFFYIIFVFLAGFPVLLGELAIGKSTGKPPVGAYRAIGPGWGFVGVMGLLACFIVLAYYSFFGGMVLEYLFAMLGLRLSGRVLWHLIFMLITVAIVIMGVRRGVEAGCKIMVPVLVLLLIYIMASTLSLPSAGSAMRFLFAPDFKKLSLAGVSGALTQVFFSLSVGQGCMITYGSYMSGSSSLPRQAAIIPLLDTLSAVLAAAAIMPAVFAAGMDPAMGPDMMFRAVPDMFASMSGGKFLAALFFAVLFFAALTSAVSMLETLVSQAEASGKLSRRTAAAVIGALCAAAGIPVCLSYGGGGGGVFEIYERVSQYGLMCTGSLISCFLIVKVWKPDAAINAAFGSPSKPGRLWIFTLKYITPPLLVFVILSVFFL